MGSFLYNTMLKFPDSTTTLHHWVDTHPWERESQDILVQVQAEMQEKASFNQVRNKAIPGH